MVVLFSAALLSVYLSEMFDALPCEGPDSPGFVGLPCQGNNAWQDRVVYRPSSFKSSTSSRITRSFSCLGVVNLKFKQRCQETALSRHDR